jgi:hypothetical protein
VNNSGLNVSSFDSVRVLTHANADSDGDGMPDSYELANGFDRFNAADAIQDSDGDGVPNQHEFRAGTNPRSAASVLRITRMQRVGNDLVLSFLSGTGAIYAIDRTTNLPSFTWQTLTNVGPFSNSPTTITNSGGAKFPNSFYRVRVPGP